MKRKVLVIGIGAGNPEFVTVQAVNALNQVSVFFIPNKGSEKQDLARLRREICDRFITIPTRGGGKSASFISRRRQSLA